MKYCCCYMITVGGFHWGLYLWSYTYQRSMFWPGPSVMPQQRFNCAARVGNGVAHTVILYAEYPGKDTGLILPV